MITTEAIIDQYVDAHYGEADARSKELFREQLAVLVAMAKCEQLRECSVDLALDTRASNRGTVH
jgi:hypothetical protein